LASENPYLSDRDMSTAGVLFVSTDAKVIASVRGALSVARVPLRIAHTFEEATARSEERPVDAILVQTDAPGSDMRERLTEGLRFRRYPPVIAVAGEVSIRDAVRAVRAGARDYVAADRITPDAIMEALRRLSRSAATDRYAPGANEPYPAVVTADYRMRMVCRMIATVADSKATLLMEGESGTGKNLLARLMHENSVRRNDPFVEVNCGVLSDTLLESELFGHARGAFTSAYRDRRGKFEIADGGTVFLDEVSNASPSLQAKLLQAVETGRFVRLGETRTLETDVRLVVAANVSLEERTREGLFREDLLHRLDQLKVTLPPVRERVGDIPLLARHFLAVLARQHGRPARTFCTEALECLVHYSWPGNVRELRNVVERAVVLADGVTVYPDTLPPHVADSLGQAPGNCRGRTCHRLKEALREPERQYLLRALRLVGWNKQDAARRLRISRSTLYKKIKEHGLECAEPADPVVSLGGIGTS